MELTEDQTRLLRLAGHHRLYRTDEGAYWLHPWGPNALPEQVLPHNAEVLIDAELLVVEDVPSVWLGHRIVPAVKEN